MNISEESFAIVESAVVSVDQTIQQNVVSFDIEVEVDVGNPDVEVVVVKAVEVKLPHASKALGIFVVSKFKEQLACTQPNPDGSFTLGIELPIDKSYTPTDDKDFPPASPSFMESCAPDTSDKKFKPALALMNPKIIKILLSGLQSDHSNLAKTHTWALVVVANSVNLLLREKAQALVEKEQDSVASDLDLRKKNPFPSDDEIEAAKHYSLITPLHKEGLSKSAVWTIAGTEEQCVRYFKSKNLKFVKTKDQPKNPKLVRVRVFFEERAKPANANPANANPGQAAAGGGGEERVPKSFPKKESGSKKGGKTK